MNKIIKAYTLEFSIEDGTINPAYAPDYEDCYEHTEEAIQDDLWRKMMATGHCDSWESCGYSDLSITVQVGVEKDINQVIADLLEVTMSDPDLEYVERSVRSKRIAKVREIIWDQEACDRRIDLINEEPVILFHSDDRDADD